MRDGLPGWSDRSLQAQIQPSQLKQIPDLNKCEHKHTWNVAVLWLASAVRHAQCTWSPPQHRGISAEVAAPLQNPHIHTNSTESTIQRTPSYLLAEGQITQDCGWVYLGRLESLLMGNRGQTEVGVLGDVTVIIRGGIQCFASPMILNHWLHFTLQKRAQTWCSVMWLRLKKRGCDLYAQDTGYLENFQDNELADVAILEGVWTDEICMFADTDSCQIERANQWVNECWSDNFNTVLSKIFHEEAPKCRAPYELNVWSIKNQHQKHSFSRLHNQMLKQQWNTQLEEPVQPSGDL